MKKFWLGKCAALLIFVISSCAVHSQSYIQLEPLGEVIIPYNYSQNGTPVGGLSGLAYDARADKYYVVSDDRSELAAARFYTFSVQLNEDGRLDEQGINLKEVTFLKSPDGNKYKINTIDPEGISMGPDSLLYISSEGGRNKSTAPFIQGYTKEGSFARAFGMPGAYWSQIKADRAEQGIRTNLAFESLTLSPDGQSLYAATENALMQDGAAADSSSPSPARIIVYDLQTGKMMHEYQYMVDEVQVLPGKRGPFAVNGLSDLLALDNEGRLLALERSYVQGQGNHIMLYDVSIKSATDLKGVASMDDHKSITPVTKRPVANLGDYNITMDNYEGLVLGPELPGGGRLLLIVSDNNFSEVQQTVFAAFRLHM